MADGLQGEMLNNTVTLLLYAKDMIEMEGALLSPQQQGIFQEDLEYMHYCMEKFNLTCYGELYNKSLKLEDEEPLKEDA